MQGAEAACRRGAAAGPLQDGYEAAIRGADEREARGTWGRTRPWPRQLASAVAERRGSEAPLGRVGVQTRGAGELGRG